MSRACWYWIAVVAVACAVGRTPDTARAAEPDAAVSHSAASDSVWAESETPTDSLRLYRLNEVVVTADRLPADPGLYFSNVTVATGADLRELSSSTAGEALATDSGLGLKSSGSYGSLQTLSMRGGSSNEVVYLVDGVPISDPQVSSLDLNWLPRSGTSRVEAMKGGASSVYGSGAIGGVVNLVSMDAAPDVPSAGVDFWNGSFGSRSVGVTLRRALAWRLGVLAAYDYARSDGWLPNSASDGEKLYGKLTKDFSGFKLGAVGFRHTSEVEIPGDYPGTQSDTRKFLRISVSEATRYDLGADYYHSSSDETYVSESACYGQSLYLHRGTMDGFRAEGSRRSGERAATSLGVGFERRSMDSSSSGKRSAHDVYASARQEFNLRPWRLSGSLRVEDNSQFSTEVSPQASAWLLLANGVTLFSKIDRSFAYPTFNDLYWRGPMEAGDPDLKTEHSIGVEVGARLERGAVRLAGTGYYRRTSDMILWRAVEECALRQKSTNADVGLKGIELSLAIEPAEGLDASLSYWLGTATDRATGEPLEYRPTNVFAWHARAARRLSAHVECGLALAGRNVSSVDPGFQWEAKPPECTSKCVSDTRLPHYSSAQAYAYIGVDRGRVFGRINNLFDDVIYSSWGMPALPGRSYEVGLSLELRD